MTYEYKGEIHSGDHSAPTKLYLDTGEKEVCGYSVRKREKKSKT